MSGTLRHYLGAASGLCSAVSYALTVVLLSGPLLHLDRCTYKAMAGAVGLILSPVLWIARGELQKSQSDVSYDSEYLGYLIAG